MGTSRTPVHEKMKGSVLKMVEIKKIAVLIIVLAMVTGLVACGSGVAKPETEKMKTVIETPSQSVIDSAAVLSDSETYSEETTDISFLLSQMELYDSDGDRITRIELNTELWLPPIGLFVFYDPFLNSAPAEISRLEGDCVYYEFFYDGFGQLSQKTAYNSNNEICFIYNFEYDPDGNLIKESGRKPENTSYAYIRTLQRDITGKVLTDYYSFNDEVSQKYRRSYDVNGNLIDECYLREDDSVWYDKNYTYGEDNTIQRSEITWYSGSEIIDRYYLQYDYTLNSFGDIESVEEYRLGWDYNFLTKYDKAGNTTYEQITTQSSSETVICEYNENDNIIKVQYSSNTDRGNKIILEVNYIYDEYKNVTKEDIYVYQELDGMTGERVFSVLYEYIPFTAND